METEMIETSAFRGDGKGAVPVAAAPPNMLGIGMQWRIRGAEAQDSFCCLELTLQPDCGVPRHHHDYVESFYVLTGEIRLEIQDGTSSRALDCLPGDAVSVPAGAQHSFFNSSATPARLLSISVSKHEMFFDAIVDADRAAPFSESPQSEIMRRLALIGKKSATWFAEPE
jgi:mannose-6-phosphate isomerase-like protein (cupin superfamily)